MTFPIVVPAGARVEEFLYEKLDRKIPSRVTNGELLGQYMTEAASDFGASSPYGELYEWPAGVARSMGSQRFLRSVHPFLHMEGGRMLQTIGDRNPSLHLDIIVHQRHQPKSPQLTLKKHVHVPKAIWRPPGIGVPVTPIQQIIK